jgi:hypothetical protein
MVPDQSLWKRAASKAISNAVLSSTEMLSRWKRVSVKGTLIIRLEAASPTTRVGVIVSEAEYYSRRQEANSPGR